MRPQFPGMDPWLERPDLWPNVHNSLIIAIRDELAPQLRPRYFVDVESRTTLLSGADLDIVYEPDVVVRAKRSRKSGRERAAVVLERTEVEPIPVVLPIEEIEETYLAIKELPGLTLVTVIEVLSSTNKKTKDGRAEYLNKRCDLVLSKVNLVEVDLLRGGNPMPLLNPTAQEDYRILICRPRPRRKTVLYSFRWPTPIPAIPIPLLPGEAEPVLDLNSILHNLMDRAGYDLVIDYRKPPSPRLRAEDKKWAAPFLARAAKENVELDCQWGDLTMNCQDHLYHNADPRQVTRRWFFEQCGVGLGAMALGQLLQQQGYAADVDTAKALALNSMAPRAPHHAPKAKRVLFLFMAGAPVIWKCSITSPSSPSSTGPCRLPNSSRATVPRSSSPTPSCSVPSSSSPGTARAVRSSLRCCPTSRRWWMTSRSSRGWSPTRSTTRQGRS